MANVCIIGMGYVGLTLAVAMANAGYKVIGVEKSAHIRERIRNGRAHFFESGLDEQVSAHVQTGQLSCSSSLPEKGSAGIFIVTVGTPLTGDGKVDVTSLRSAVDDIAATIGPDDIVILRSTVKIGTTRSVAKVIRDAAASASVAFCPERTLEGRALLELAMLPQIVGGVDEVSADRAEKIFLKITTTVIRVDSAEEAEMVKLVNNTQRDVMFAFANEVAQMCEAARVSAARVIRAACEDYPRSKIASPGLVGGPCLEKDTHILAESMRERSYTPAISLSGRLLNERLPINAIERVGRHFEKSHRGAALEVKKVTILGLAFKGEPETSDTRGSMAAHVLDAARRRWPNAGYFAYDSMTDAEDFQRLGVFLCSTIEEAFDDANLVLIQNNHRSFRNMNILELSHRMASKSIIYDFWALFDGDRADVARHVSYLVLGSMEKSE